MSSLASIKEIRDRFPDYSPSERTIYRRLSAIGITKPVEHRREFNKSVLQQIPYGVTDSEAKDCIDRVIQEAFEDLCTSIEKDAEEYKERFR